MFKTIVVACSIAMPDSCWHFIDTRGPYHSQEQCRARAYEMSNAIRQIHHDIEPKAFRCDFLEGRSL